MENIVHNDTNIKNTIAICLLSINNGLPIAWYEEGAQPRYCINIDVDMKLGFCLPIIYGKMKNALHSLQFVLV